jgi:hypothetical protein
MAMTESKKSKILQAIADLHGATLPEATLCFGMMTEKQLVCALRFMSEGFERKQKRL